MELSANLFAYIRLVIITIGLIGVGLFISAFVVLWIAPTFPAGLQLAYVGTNDPSPTYENADTEIYIFDLNRRLVYQVTHNDDFDANPAWSPDGTQIAYETARGGGGNQIDRIDVRTGQVEFITNNNVYNSHPTWSPDGTQIAYISRWEDDDDIWIATIPPMGDPDSMTAINLSNSDVREDSPEWSPDGTQLIHLVDSIMDVDIFRTTIATGNVEAIVEDDYASIHPTWSPDGTQIAYVSTRVGSYSIYILSLETGISTPITNNTLLNLRPAWSPDGRYIAYEFGQLSDRMDIYVYDIETGESRLLIEHGRSANMPTWRPQP